MGAASAWERLQRGSGFQPRCPWPDPANAVRNPVPAALSRKRETGDHDPGSGLRPHHQLFEIPDVLLGGGHDLGVHLALAALKGPLTLDS